MVLPGNGCAEFRTACSSRRGKVFAPGLARTGSAVGCVAGKEKGSGWLGSEEAGRAVLGRRCLAGQALSWDDVRILAHDTIHLTG